VAKRWTQRPEGSTWGDFGADDERGRLNLLTKEKVLQGIAEVKEGLNFCLSLPLDLPGGTALNPRRHPPELKPVYREGAVAFCQPLSRFNPIVTSATCDDAMLLYSQYSTQWDALAHCGAEFDLFGDGTKTVCFYNGWRVVDEETGTPTQGEVGAASLGIEHMAESCVQGRGVLIDFHAHYGREHKAVGYDDLMRILDDDKVEIEQGDIVAFHTGWSDLLIEYAGDPDPQVMFNSGAALNGRDPKVLQWITDSGLAVVVSDNRAVEYEWGGVTEATEPGPLLPLHDHCLFRLGVHLGEMFNIGPLARWLRENGRSRFLFTGPPLRMPGAVGSPATPVATV
jgi:kynurenine formamidase